jgi:hypothetical protein
MNCPYCAENIKDEAVVCRFCHAEVLIVGPMLRKLAKVEDWLSSLRTTIDSSLSGNETLSVDNASIAVTLSIFLSAAFSWLTWLYPNTLSNVLDRLLRFFSVASPFFVALWLGWSLPRLRLSRYLFVGLLPGFMGFVGWSLLYSANQRHYPSEWRSNLIVYVASAALWFLAGGAIGARMRIGNLRLRVRGARREADQLGDPQREKSPGMLLGIMHNVAYVLVALLPYLLAKRQATLAAYAIQSLTV